jgi:hypothetical protein
MSANGDGGRRQVSDLWKKSKTKKEIYQIL